MKYTINDVNRINDKVIDEDIFNTEKVDYVIEEREELIDHILDIASEAKENNRIMMLDDLKYLLSLDDKYLLSSIQTNEYITEKDGQEILSEIYNYKLER